MRVWRRALTIGALPLVASLSGACERPAATQTIVVLSADPGLLASAKRLVVVVQGEAGDVVLERTSDVDPGRSQLARIPLIPKGEDPTRRFVVQATLEDDTGPLAKLEVRSGYIEDELHELAVWFEDSCRGKLDCGEGRTCSAGRCLGSCYSVKSASPALPSCGECETCEGSCQPASQISCGCPGETCNAGECTPLTTVGNVSAGSVHTCAVSSGGVYCWGSSSFEDLDGAPGRLGTGDAGDALTPQKVEGVEARLALLAQGNHTCALTYGARVCWGENYRGELGIGDTAGLFPTPITAPSTPSLESLAGGFRHTCGVTQDGQLWCWGYNERGNTGTGTEPSSVRSPVYVGDFVQVAAGGDHTCAITSAGQLYCWGFNDSLEVGVPGSSVITEQVRPGCHASQSGRECFDDYQSVGAGFFHSCGIRNGGELWCWGGNTNAQLGVGVVSGANNIAEPQRVVGEQKWSLVDGGRSHTCALTVDGQLYCWGSNSSGQLGIAKSGSASVPQLVQSDRAWKRLSAGEAHTCGIKDDATLWCWGRYTHGELGLGNPSDAELSPRRVCFP
ncbi:MAG: hypothetical protein KC492_26740 [Myxococcales bacterium]|nr:hypothetical protein [Myxococcales bacterium]